MPETSNRLVRVLSAAVNGLETTPVQIEISTSTGKDFFMVGLPDSAVRESRTRVQSALRNTGFLPAALLPTRKAVSRWSLEEAHAVAARALELETENQVRAWLEENKRL